jgi:hypothetical protein
MLANKQKAMRNENLVTTPVTPSPSVGPVSGALQEMFQGVRELCVAAFYKAPAQEKLMRE